MCTSLLQMDPRDTITVGGKKRQVDPTRVGPTDVPLGDGMAGEARNAILSRRERLRIAEEGS